MNLLDLPLEILVQILCNLYLKDLFRCRRAHSSLRACIGDHPALQYHIAMLTSAMEDSQFKDDVSLSDRIALLREREKGWERLRINFKQTISVGVLASGIYDLSGGVYLLGGQGKCQIKYIFLPKIESDELRWEALEAHQPLIDIALALYEHDLIAIVTTTPSVTPGMHAIEIQLLQFSTKSPHPLASVPILHVCDTEWVYPSVSVEVVGDNLFLVIQHAPNPVQPDDTLLIFDWKKGTRKMDHSMHYLSYSGIVVLSPELILIPNMLKRAFDVWAIPSTPNDVVVPPFHLISLGLPDLADEYFISSISCRCEPNPTKVTPSAPTVKYIPYWNDPFRPHAQHAIAIFNVRVQSTRHPTSSTFSLFVHRSSLLALCPKQQGFHSINDGKELIEKTNEEEVGQEFTTRASVPSVPLSIDVVSQPFYPYCIPWDEWGPPVCRWLNTEELPTRWITTSSGQRAVVYSRAPIGGVIQVGEDGMEGVWDDSPEIEVLDFNQVNVRRLIALQKDARERRGAAAVNPENKDGDGLGDIEIIDFPSTLICHMFKKGFVKSSLAYASVAMSECELYEGVLMDEERLLGLKTNVEDAICGIDVFHLGSD